MTEQTPPVADTDEQWPLVGSRDLYRSDWVMALRLDELTTPQGGEPFGRLVLEHPGAVLVLAADDEDRVLCLWQYRHPAGRRFVELPAGLLDAPGEEPVDAARRELREEAELDASEWTTLTSIYPSPGISAEVQHLLFARGLSTASRGDFVLEHEESEMTRGWVRFEDLYQAVLSGELTDGPLVAAVLLARARGLI